MVFLVNKILNLSRPQKKFLVVSMDIFISIASTWIAYGLRLDQWGTFSVGQIIFFIATTLAAIFTFIFFGLYRAIFRYIGSSVAASFVKAFSFYFLIVAIIFAAIGVDGVPRSIGVIQPMIFCVLVAISRSVIRRWLDNFATSRSFKPKVARNALIYGAGSSGRRLAKILKHNSELCVVGFLDDGSNLLGATIDSIPIFNPTKLKNIIEKYNVRDILLAIPSTTQNRRNEIISRLWPYGIRVRTIQASVGEIDPFSGGIRLQDLDVNDLLGREQVPPSEELLRKNIESQVVLVTGSGGSIGSELCRQIMQCSPKMLILVDVNEYGLYMIYEELNKLCKSREDAAVIDNELSTETLYIRSNNDSGSTIVPCLGSVQNESLMRNIFSKYRPSIVFHAAAYKHVPLVEANMEEGLRNNIIGTLVCAKVSQECNVTNFILISSDKAVRPSSIMGVSKRIAELILQSIDAELSATAVKTIFSIVRFGNVLGSSGSVVPLFSSQINSGGPLTITHPDVTRYFMTIPEAAQLVIQASTMAKGGDLFLLDMGEPIRILDLATKMICLSGHIVKNEKQPHGDIEILYTGLRKGEKLHEELLIGAKPVPTEHPKIMKAHEDLISWGELEANLNALIEALNFNDLDKVGTILRKIVPGYAPSN